MPILEEKKDNLEKHDFWHQWKKQKAFFAWIFHFVLFWSVIETESQCDIFVLIFDVCSIKLLFLGRGRRSLLFGNNEVYCVRNWKEKSSSIAERLQIL